jgi:hypothetical protein
VLRASDNWPPTGIQIMAAAFRSPTTDDERLVVAGQPLASRSVGKSFCNPGRRLGPPFARPGRYGIPSRPHFATLVSDLQMLAKIAYRRNTDRELRFVIAAWGEMDLGLGSCRNNSVGWCGDRWHRFSTGRIPRSARPRLDMMITPARDLSEQFPTRSQAVARGFLISIVMCTCRIIPGIRQPDRP